MDRCLRELVDRYNGSVFSHYDGQVKIIESRATELLGGGYTTDPIPDTIYRTRNGIALPDPLTTADLLTIGISENTLVVIGGGPIGLSLSIVLCDMYPTRTILLIENRVISQHVRAPYTRTRRLAGVASIKINDVEANLHESLDQRLNMRFLYYTGSVAAIIEAFNIKVVFDCTGGRFSEFQNSVYDTLYLKHDQQGRLIALIRDAYGNRFLGRSRLATTERSCNPAEICDYKQIHSWPVDDTLDTDNYTFISRELVVTYTNDQGESIDINVVANPGRIVVPALQGRQHKNVAIEQVNWYADQNNPCIISLEIYQYVINTVSAWSEPFVEITFNGTHVIYNEISELGPTENNVYYAIIPNPGRLVPPDLSGNVSKAVALGQILYYSTQQCDQLASTPDKYSPCVGYGVNMCDVYNQISGWNENIKVSHFWAGLRFHHLKPADIHTIGAHRFVKIDIGDTIGSVPIKYGTNIPIGRNIIQKLLLPAVDEMLNCTA